MRVFVYYNFNKSLLSIRAVGGRYGGQVIAHAESLQMRDVIFKVSEAGRQRVLRERRKSVHAGVVGKIQSAWGLSLRNVRDDFDPREIGVAGVWQPLQNGNRVTYNPYKAAHFMLGTRPVASAKWLQLDRSMMRAFNWRLLTEA